MIQILQFDPVLLWNNYDFWLLSSSIVGYGRSSILGQMCLTDAPIICIHNITCVRWCSSNSIKAGFDCRTCRYLAILMHVLCNYINICKHNCISMLEKFFRDMKLMIERISFIQVHSNEALITEKTSFEHETSRGSETQWTRVLRRWRTWLNMCTTTNHDQNRPPLTHYTFLSVWRT